MKAINRNEFIETPAIEVDGIEYEVAPRTLEREQKFAKLNEKADTMLQWEYQKEILIELVGKEAYKAIIPDEKDMNMDFFEAVFNGAVEAYNYKKEEAKKQKREKQIEEIKDVASQAEKLTSATKAVGGMNREQRRKFAKQN